jgi:hypothetical protein
MNDPHWGPLGLGLLERFIEALAHDFTHIVWERGHPQGPTRMHVLPPLYPRHESLNAMFVVTTKDLHGESNAQHGMANLGLGLGMEMGMEVA